MVTLLLIEVLHGDLVLLFILINRELSIGVESTMIGSSRLVNLTRDSVLRGQLIRVLVNVVISRLLVLVHQGYSKLLVDHLLILMAAQHILSNRLVQTTVFVRFFTPALLRSSLIDFEGSMSLVGLTR